MTLRELALEYWIPYKRRRVKASTLSTYDTNLRTHILPVLGERVVYDLGAEELNDFILEQAGRGGSRADGRPLASKTVREIALLLGQLLKFAALRGALADLSVLDELVSLSVLVPEIRTLTWEEEKRLYDCLCASPDPCALGAIMMLYTGIRLGELCALTWRDIDLTRGTLSITKTMQRIKNLDGGGARTVVIVDRPKSPKSVRVVPLPPFLHELLHSFRSGAPGDAYFLTGEPRKFIEPRVYRSRFETYRQEARLPGEIHVHCLRHTFATRCVELGVEVKTLSELLGHSSVQITLDRYVHSSFSKKQTEMQKLSPAG